MFTAAAPARSAVKITLRKLVFMQSEHPQEAEQQNDPDNDAQSYFHQQAQHLSHINETLASAHADSEFRKWLSIVLEALCYLAFAVVLILVLISSNNPVPEGLTGKEFYGDEQTALDARFVMIITKIATVAVSLPVLFLAIALGRNRRKSRIIREAQSELLKMKKESEASEQATC